MAFTIYSDTHNVVSVQTDDHGTFQVVGQGPAHALNVNLGYAQVHVAGAGVKQAQRTTGVANGSHFKVELVNEQVRIQPVPH